jgi:ubiquinone biosynthesis protein Coq4
MRPELATAIRHPIATVRALRNFAITVWDPTRSDIQQGINRLVRDALRDVPPERITELERERPDVARLFSERYDPPLETAKLEAMPEGSLGREYARFIHENKIDPLGTLLAMGEPENLLQYVQKRAYKLHDLMHVALGCDASILGEVRIVSYSLGQSMDTGERAGRAPAAALAVLFLHLLLRRLHEFKPAVRLAAEWMALGERARPHVSFRLEDHLERPVGEVRALVLAAA